MAIQALYVKRNILLNLVLVSMAAISCSFAGSQEQMLGGPVPFPPLPSPFVAFSMGAIYQNDTRVPFVGDPLTPQMLSSTAGTDSGDDTNTLNSIVAQAAAHQPASGGTRPVFLPCGIYRVSTWSIPGLTGNKFSSVHIRGAGDCTVITQISTSAGADVVQIGNAVNSTGDIIFERMAIDFEGTGNKTAGAGIRTYGSARLQIRDVHMLSGKMHDCIDMNGVTTLMQMDGTVCLAPQNDCWQVYSDGNTPGAGGIITANNLCNYPVNDGLVIGGRIGGFYVDASILAAGRYGVWITNSLATAAGCVASTQTGYQVAGGPCKNREIITGPAATFDNGNTNSLFVDNNAVEHLKMVGTYANGGLHGPGILIMPQGPPTSMGQPAVGINGAQIQMDQVTSNQGPSNQLTYEDDGILTITNSSFSWAGGAGILLMPGPDAQISIMNSSMINNGSGGIYLAGTPANGVVIGNILSGNAQGSTLNLYGNIGFTCMGNRGNSDGC